MPTDPEALQRRVTPTSPPGRHHLAGSGCNVLTDKDLLRFIPQNPNLHAQQYNNLVKTVLPPIRFQDGFSQLRRGSAGVGNVWKPDFFSSGRGFIVGD